LQKAVRRGEEVDYIISVCNRGGQAATNVTVRDVFDTSVEIISFWPEIAQDGAWHFSSLYPGQCQQMGLSIKVPRRDVQYQSSQNISGQGFIRSFRDFSTSRPSAPLVNRVYVSSDQMQLSVSARVQILAEEGTELSLREHGSGDYENREDLRFLTANKSIRLERMVRAEHHPVVLSLSDRGSGQIVSTLWQEEVRAKNGITNTTLVESYRHSARLEEESLFDLDENQSRMQIESDFQGQAHLGMLQRLSGGYGHRGDMFSAEDYAGAFQLRESADDLGQGLMIERSALGQGYVAKDAQDWGVRSYEFGSGGYRSEEQMDSISGFMKKDLEAVHGSESLRLTPRTSLNISQRWSEGMISRTKNSLISEEYSSASRLKMRAVAASLAERESEVDFSGDDKLRAEYEGKSSENHSLKLDRDEELQGDYRVKRKILLSGTARYNRPHLHLIKEGRRIKDVGVYTVTFSNDGNVALGPLFLQEIFPPGARFINATLRPLQVDQSGCNWTLLHLAIGDTVRIGINLDVERCPGDVINRAVAVGNCSEGQVSAQNLSVMDRAWLGGCSPEDLPSGHASGDAFSLGCACWEPGAVNQTDYLDPTQMTVQWDSQDQGDGSCPVSCPALEEGHKPPGS
jgi:uncharacterized repeat protein (TIGR01451 family)